MAVPGTSKWICPSCTYHNWFMAAKCTLCHCAKPPDNVRIKTPSPKLRGHSYNFITTAATRPEPGASIYPPRITSPDYPISRSPLTSYSPVMDDDSSNDRLHCSPSGITVSAEMPSGKWRCQSCTYSNWPNVNQCIVCRTVRGTRPPRSPGSSRQRANEAARGFLPSDSILDYASHLGAVGGAGHGSGVEGILPMHTRDSPLHPGRSKGGRNGNKTASNVDNRAVKKWKCLQCTYENWPRASKCVLCYHPRKRTPSPPLLRPQTDDFVPRSPLHDSTPSHTSSSSPTLSHHPDNYHLPTHPRTSNFNEASATVSPDIPPSPSNLASDESTASLLIPYAPPSPEIVASVRLKSGSDEVRQIRNRLSTSDWMFLNACLGVVNDDVSSVRAYLRQGGDRSRQLTKDECLVLGEASKFTVGSTLVHLAIRFQRSELLSLLLTPATSDARKRLPSHSNPDLASSIREEVALTLRQHKGDWPCYFMTRLTTFTLPADIVTFCQSVQKRLFSEVVDGDVEKELEIESAIINWSSELTEELGSRLYPLWNRTAGDCLLDSVLQATWGVVDRDSTLRKAMADSLVDGASKFYERWKEAEQRQSHAQGFSLDEDQLRQDWEAVVALADQPGHSLEQAHIFALAHVLRRPIVVYGVKVVKNYRGENLGFVNFEGVYLPVVWEASFCWKSPVALAYTRGHFSALVSMYGQPSEAGAWSNRPCDTHVTYLPLVDSEGRQLPVHFLTEQEVGCEERLLNDYCDCHVTRVGTLTARQEVTCQQQPSLVVQLVDEWLDRFFKMNKRKEAASCTYDSD